MNLNKRITYFLLLFALHVAASNSALQVDSAKIAYEKGDYKKAINIYEEILRTNLESADLYYNLGNSYFKNNEIGMAILNYEKAKKLSSQDEDIITNLKIANQRIEDKIDPAPELFLNQWKKNVFDLMDEKEWSIFLIVLFSLALFLFSMYFLSSNKVIKQIGFFGGGIFILLSVITFIITFKKYKETIYSNEAIIISPSSNVNAAPSEKSTKLFILHEGTKVKINEENGIWTEIKIANGNLGWIKTATLKNI